MGNLLTKVCDVQEQKDLKKILIHALKREHEDSSGFEKILDESFIIRNDNMDMYGVKFVLRTRLEYFKALKRAELLQPKEVIALREVLD